MTWKQYFTGLLIVLIGIGLMGTAVWIARQPWAGWAAGAVMVLLLAGIVAARLEK